MIESKSKKLPRSRVEPPMRAFPSPFVALVLAACAPSPRAAVREPTQSSSALPPLPPPVPPVIGDPIVVEEWPKNFVPTASSTHPEFRHPFELRPETTAPLPDEPGAKPAITL